MKVFSSVSEESLTKIRFALILLLTLAPFLPFLLDQTQVLLYRDLSQTDLPAKTFWLRTLLSEGQFPRWNYLSAGGYPFYADLTAGPLHPFNFLFLLFGEAAAPQALSFFVLLHYPLIFWGFYRLFRHLGFSRPLAECAALLGAWNGYALSAYNLTHILVGVTALPWFAFSFLRAMKTRKWTDIFHSSFWLSVPIFGGDPQFTYIFSLIAAFTIFSSHQRASALGTIVKVFGLTALLASAQLLPSLELLRQSDRISTGGDSSTWALAPMRLIELLLPNFTGTYTDILNFAGREFTGKLAPVFFINSIYIGILPLFALTWALVSGWFTRRLRKTFSLWALSLFTGLFLILSMGSWLNPDLFSLAAKWMPFWKGFRYPERLSIYFLFPIIVASFFCLKSCLRLIRISNSPYPRTILGSSILLGSMITISYFLNSDMPGSGEAFRHSILCLLSLSGLFYLFKRMNDKKPFYLLLLLLVGFDLSFLFERNLAFQSASITEMDAYPLTSQIAEDVEKREHLLVSGAPDRFISLDQSKDQWWDQALALSQLSQLEYGELTNWEGLSGNVGTYFSLANGKGHHSLPLNFTVFTDLWALDPVKTMSLLGVRYILSRPPNVERPLLRLNSEALPNFYFAKHIIYAASFSDVSKVIRNIPLAENFLVLEGVDRILSPASDDLVPHLKVVRSDSATFTLAVNKDSAASAFVWNTTHYPPWQASLNGKKIEILRANGWSMAVALPPLKEGFYELTFEYDDRWIRLGQTLSGLWALALAFVLALRWRKVRRA